MDRAANLTGEMGTDLTVKRKPIAFQFECETDQSLKFNFQNPAKRQRQRPLSSGWAAWLKRAWLGTISVVLQTKSLTWPYR